MSWRRFILEALFEASLVPLTKVLDLPSHVARGGQGSARVRAATAQV
jgi:hypothetical protein